MNLVDVHCHLDHSKFKKDLGEVIKNSIKVGVKAIINSGVNPSTNRICLELSKKFPLIKPSFGIYPIDALSAELDRGEADGFVRDTEKFDLNKELEWIENNKDKCIAIGEIGLDYKWVTGKETEQKEIFKKILKTAEKINKPVIIHSRKAELDAIEILEKSKLKKILLHCFNGRKSLIKRAVENKYYFSIPPIITRLEHFKLLAELVPIEQILTETDAPYLSPVQGERNEPKNVRVTITEIAKIKKLSEEKVADIIFQNYKRFFNQ